MTESLLSIPVSLLDKEIDTHYRMLEESAAKSRIYTTGFNFGFSIAELNGPGTSRRLDQKINYLSVQTGVFLADTTREGEGYTINMKDPGISDPNFLEGYLSGVATAFANEPMVAEQIEEGKFVLKQKSKDFDKQMTSYLSGEHASPGVDLPRIEVPRMNYQITQGESYFLTDNSTADKTLAVLANEISNGKKALCLTTTYPPKIKAKHDLGTLKPIWITDLQSGNQEIQEINPTRLNFELTQTIFGFLKQNQEGILVLHGLEYLVAENGSEETIKFLRKAKGTAEMNNCTILCPIDPKTFEPTVASNIERCFDNELTTDYEDMFKQ